MWNSTLLNHRLDISILTSIVFITFIAIVLHFATSDSLGATVDVGPGETYTTIQAGIDAASPGDTVAVAKGTYNETPEITKSITLTGSTNKDTVINGQRGGDVLTVNASDVKVSWLVLKNCSHNDVFAGVKVLKDNTNCEIDHVFSSGLLGCGVYLEKGCKNTRIHDCELNFNRYYGIFVASSCDNLEVEDNNCSSNEEDGIWLHPVSDKCTIKGNKFLFNEQNGIAIRGLTGSTISHNNCSGNKAVGILVSGYSYGGAPVKWNEKNSITDNHCNDNAWGISLGVSNETVVKNNVANGNSYTGIEVGKVYKCTVDGNEFNGGSFTGIMLDGSGPESKVINNECDNNTHWGIYVTTESSLFLIQGNKVSNHVSGVRLVGNNNTFDRNEVWNHTRDGIVLGGDWERDFSWHNNVTNNSVHDNDRHGIIITSCFNRIGSNEVYECRNGIVVRNHNNTLEGNRCHTISHYGILCGRDEWRDHPAYLRVANNTVSGSDQVGIVLSTIPHSEVVGNRAFDNNKGFSIAGDGYTVENNEVRDNDHGISIGGESNSVCNNTFRSNVFWDLVLSGGSLSNRVIGNEFYDSTLAIWLGRSHNNTIRDNWIEDAGTSIKLQLSDNNTIFNNWFDSTKNWEVESSSGNVWNVSKTRGENICGFDYLGGNYWSGYDGVDNDGDGLGDTLVPHGPGDHLPLMRETVPPTVSDKTQGSPTTGDDYNLSVEVTDNTRTHVVWLVYWLGTSSRTNVTLGGPGDGVYNWTLHVASNETRTLHYQFGASDRSHNWAETRVKDVAVLDNDSPLVTDTDVTSSATTGDDFLFNANATDNIVVEEVVVEYWFDGIPRFNLSMVNHVAETWTLQISVPHKIGTMHYVIGAKDSSDLWNWTQVTDVTVLDNDNPYLDLDMTPEQVGTGEEANLSARCDDNIEVLEVSVEYWFGEGSHTNASMNWSGGSLWSHHVRIPIDELVPLNYRFFLQDTSANYIWTEARQVEVMDIIPPEVVTDGTQDIGIAGEPFTFEMNATDNIGVSDVHVEYWYSSGARYNISMEGQGNDTWTIIIVLDLTSEPLNYRFHVRDVAGMLTSSDERQVVVRDTDLPGGWNDMTGSEATTGDPFTFITEVSDAMGVASVWVNYSLPGGGWSNETLSSYGPLIWKATVLIPLDKAGPVTYRFHAFDLTGNHNMTRPREVLVHDDEPPVIGPREYMDIVGYDDPISLTVNCTDNIGLEAAWVVMEAPDGGQDELSLEMDVSGYWFVITSFSELGAHSITFHASDASGNEANWQGPDIEVVDRIAPELGEIAVEPEIQTLGYSVTISVEAFDTFGVNLVWIEVETPDGSLLNESMTKRDDDAWSWISTPSVPGNYSFHVFAEDTNGNLNNSDTCSFQLSEDHPSNGDDGDQGGEDGLASSDLFFVIILVVGVVMVLIAVTLLRRK